MDKVPLTRAGYDRLRDEIKHRNSVERPRIIEAIAQARALGDLSENAEYHAAKEEQGKNESRIKELEDIAGRADIIDVAKLSGNEVKFGASLTLLDEETEKKQNWQIVGAYEADAAQGKISIASPIAKALIGRAKGDSVEVHTPNGAKYYEIQKVEYK